MILRLLNLQTEAGSLRNRSLGFNDRSLGTYDRGLRAVDRKKLFLTGRGGGAFITRDQAVDIARYTAMLNWSPCTQDRVDNYKFFSCNFVSFRKIS